MAFSQIFFGLGLILLLCDLVQTHSWQSEPPAYNEVFRTRSCRGSECTQACPSIFARGMKNSRERPARTWKRGQSVSIKWVRNNHRGGLVRMSLVPADQMMSKPWHKKLAIWYGCWESGAHRCSGAMCGTDTDGTAFGRRMVIPSTFPDGDYVAAVVWYGGIEFMRERGQFPDYHSCSFVRIRGGTPVTSSFQPFWEAGDTGEFNHGGECRSAADEVGVCPKTGCRNAASWTVAKSFKGGRRPARITPWIVASAFRVRPTFTVSGSGRRNAPTSPVRTPPPTRPPPSRPSGGNSRPGRGGVFDLNKSICAGKVCCPKSCGACGGNGCAMRNGGRDSCCYLDILRKRRSCNNNAAPCVRT